MGRDGKGWEGMGRDGEGEGWGGMGIRRGGSSAPFLVSTSLWEGWEGWGEMGMGRDWEGRNGERWEGMEVKDEKVWAGRKGRDGEGWGEMGRGGEGRGGEGWGWRVFYPLPRLNLFMGGMGGMARNGEGWGGMGKE